MGETLEAVIAMKVDDEAMIQRVVNRAAEAKAAGKMPRADDTAEAMETRLKAYYKDTSTLIGYYHAKGMLTWVDGMASMDEVKAAIADVLDGRANGA